MLCREWDAQKSCLVGATNENYSENYMENRRPVSWAPEPVMSESELASLDRWITGEKLEGLQSMPETQLELLEPKHSRNKRDFSVVEEWEQQKLKEMGATIVTDREKDWPKEALRCLGAIPPGPRVAIVGTRRADRYGLDVAERIAKKAVLRGCSVVSGGAFGIDKAAHEAALNVGGQTVVVLGSGLDCATPRVHQNLFKRAAENGALVSPFSLGCPAQNWTFPKRNPWIAALSDVVIVVQADLHSGALQTARAALLLRRPVYVVPGPMDSPLHQGCHTLIQEGAQLLMGAGNFAVRDLAAERLVDLSAVEPLFGLPIWFAASVEPRTVDELAWDSCLTPGEAMSQVTALEAKGWLRSNGLGRYVRCVPTI